MSGLPGAETVAVLSVAESSAGVAEYVQDAESLQLLGDLGVDMAQGYFVGKPAEAPLQKSTPISLEYRRLRQTIS